MPAASITAESFSCGLQSSGRFAGSESSSWSVTPRSLPASLSQRDRVPCATPTSCESAFADILRGPVMRPTILDLNFSVYCFCTSVFSRPPPELSGFPARQPRRQLP